MIPFNRPTHLGSEDGHVITAVSNMKMSGDGEYGLRCKQWFEKRLGCKIALLTPSCTHALELAALLIDVQPGDEVIMPSYTFVSTANAFVLRGASVVFVDIRQDTLNIDETLIEAAITKKTKAIVVVHYAGVACEMRTIMNIANRHGVFVIEDAAQGMMSTYEGRQLGTLGHIAAYSFHETKNFTSGGEGGLIIINDEQFVSRAEIVREKGTNRSRFFRGEVDKYTWIDIGSSYLLSDIQAAYLWGQLEHAEEITNNRMRSWQSYLESLRHLDEERRLELPTVPVKCTHNGHMFYIKTKNLLERTALLEHLKSLEIHAVFHYVPLHSSIAGLRFGRFNGKDNFTTTESERVIRLPMYYNITDDELSCVTKAIDNFYSSALL